MATTFNVKELFAPLAQRLLFFKMKEYFTSSISHYYGEDHITVHQSPIIKELKKKFSYYEPKEVVHLASGYIQKAKKLIAKLQPITHVYLDYEGQIENEIKIASAENKKTFIRIYKTELEDYIVCLEAIVNQYSESDFENPNPTITSTEPPTVIQLPTNFTVTQLNKIFTPLLSLSQAALFLYYLREKAVIPPYSDASIGKLGEFFLVRNQKNIAKSISDIHSLKLKKKELQPLKDILQTLLAEIDLDIKRAR